MTKQEESRMIQNSMEEFLRQGGKITKLPPAKAHNPFNLDVFKERVDALSHALSLFEETTPWNMKSTHIRTSTRLKNKTKNRKYFHPWVKNFLWKEGLK
jgi:hypothetical protein